MFWLVFLLFFLALLILFVLMQVEILVHYKRDAENDRMELKFQALGGFLHYRLILPAASLLKKNQNQPSEVVAPIYAGVNEPTPKTTLSMTPSTSWQTLEQTFDRAREVWRIFEEVKDHVLSQFKIFRVYELRWKTEFGVGDAAATGTLAGLAWAVKGSVIGVMSHFITLGELPKLEIKPAYFHEGFSTDISCIIRFRLGEAIVAGTKVAIYWLKEGRSWSTQLKG